MLQTGRERIDFKSRRRDRRLSLGPALGRRHLECRDTALRPRLWYRGSGAPRRLGRALRQLSRHARRAANQRHHARENCRKAQFTVSLVGCSRAAESASEPWSMSWIMSCGTRANRLLSSPRKAGPSCCLGPHFRVDDNIRSSDSVNLTHVYVRLDIYTVRCDTFFTTV